jgi:hypothetical protein
LIGIHGRLLHIISPGQASPSRCPAAGYIFTPQRWARDNQTHPPHVMSDHILLAAAVHGGAVSEALLPLLNWWHAQATGALLFLVAFCSDWRWS